MKLLPRIMPVFMTNSAPEIKAKFDTPDFVENNEEMLKEEFTKYFQVMSFLRLRVCSISRFKKTLEYMESKLVFSRGILYLDC